MSQPRGIQVGLDLKRVAEILRKQTKPDICWAAGIETVLAHEHLMLAQDQIVREVYKKAYDTEHDKRLTCEEIKNFLDRIRKRDANGTEHKLKVTSYPGYMVTTGILKELRRKKPILVSYDKLDPIKIQRRYGHIVVIVGAIYENFSNVFV